QHAERQSDRRGCLKHRDGSTSKDVTWLYFPQVNLLTLEILEICLEYQSRSLRLDGYLQLKFASSDLSQFKLPVSKT
ncbi:9444_t:CDS:2, partial [Cetraspora pellucida]